MIPGMNPRMMKQAMRRMGIESQEVDASEVLIKCPDKTILIRNPNVSIVTAMGQKTYQIVGEEEELSTISPEDIETVMEQASVSVNEAKAALEETGGDLAAAILKLKK